MSQRLLGRRIRGRRCAGRTQRAIADHLDPSLSHRPSDASPSARPTTAPSATVRPTWPLLPTLLLLPRSTSPRPRYVELRLPFPFLPLAYLWGLFEAWREAPDHHTLPLDLTLPPLHSSYSPSTPSFDIAATLPPSPNPLLPPTLFDPRLLPSTPFDLPSRLLITPAPPTPAIPSHTPGRSPHPPPRDPHATSTAG